jgi:IclR family pca regulon transcriptional regulator
MPVGTISAQMTKRNSAEPSGTLSRGLRVLLCVAKLGGHVGLVELSKGTRLPRGTAHRLAVKLVELGFLERDSEGRFSAGVHVLDLGFTYLASLGVRAQALPEMQRLCDELECSVGLCIVDGTEMVYIERIEPPRLELTLRAGVGQRFPIYSTAAGKAMLAFLPEVRQKEILKGIKFEPLTARSPRTRAAFEAELRTTKTRRYSISDQEYVHGYRAVAAPILDSSNAPIAVIVAGAGVARFTSIGQVRETIAPRVVEASRIISARLGESRSALPVEIPSEEKRGRRSLRGAAAD